MTDVTARAQQAGIELCYTDVWGESHDVPQDTVLQLLDALGPQQAESGVPRVQVVQAEQRVKLRMSGARSWQLLREDETSVAEGDFSGQSLTLPPLPMGYYTLRLRGVQEQCCTLIVAPPRCFMPDKMQKGKRVWGIAAQLYSLRSNSNWGIGDFGDVKELVKNSASLGADVVGLNPLHALFEGNPKHFSPYSPSNRLYLNTLYIDVTAVDGFMPAMADVQALEQARSAELVDYASVAALKGKILRALYAQVSARGENEAFRTFCAAGGEDLHRHAVFEALCVYFSREQGAFVPWQQWPVQFQQPENAEVKAFAQAHADEVRYYCWLQWIADTQLASAQNTAISKGMEVGLYCDLAVGADKAGAEVWMDAELFIKGVSVGVPADEYNPKGQNWGLPPFNPHMLRARGFAPFIRMLRANMRHARALRIDHAFGLRRLFLIPDGKEATQGAFVTYPFEELLAVIKIESHRQRCIVIGEDLGTFPPGYEVAAAEAGLLSYKLLYFERGENAFTPPERYPAQSLATLSTHDLPTLKGWLEAADIDEREKLGLYPNSELIAKDRESRKRDRPLLEQALGGEITFERVQRFLCQSPASIVMTQWEDVLGLATQANLPATTTQRPNWRMKMPQTLEQLFARNAALTPLAQAMNEERAKPLVDVPRATYRLQFHKGFTFKDAVAIMPYLVNLGVSHLYASPYLTARPGSTHGYDITDHRAMNPELGGEEGYKEFLDGLEANGLKQILDFVPNHMGVGGSDNAWWLGVLEWGRSSPFSGYFDIDWTPRVSGATPKLIVPFLGDHYGEVLDRGELALRFDAAEGSFSVWYGEHRFPICPSDYAVIDAAFAPVKDYEEGQELKARIARTGEQHAQAQQRVQEINADVNTLHALLERQHYRLAFWRTAASDINYRRFFDISDLAGMRVEVPELFDTMHERVLALIHAGKLQGLRIDHIDGLADPAAYCRRLREKAGSQLYLTVEKILGQHEALPTDWQIDGTSGYDALNMIGDVLVDAKAQGAFDRLYERFTHREKTPEEHIYQAKLQILESTLASELQALASLLKRITAQSRYTRDYTLDTVRQALKEIIGWFPVYRTYITSAQVSATDVKTVQWAVARAKKLSRMADASVYDAIASKLLLEEKPVQEESATFVRKFQQLSGPVMAKGVEDTAFYRYTRLLSLNEVGGSIARFGMSVKAFHATNTARAKDWPHAMLATATHDTKRGEDMRMRLHALSEMPKEWSHHLRQWAATNRTRFTQLDGRNAPTRGDEYFIYQTLLGSWPFELMQNPQDEAALDAYKARLDAYMVKALREAKLHSDWNQPNEAYEKAAQEFIHAILSGNGATLFMDSFVPFAQKLAVAGAVNSLSQTVLKFTLPGVPDIYQGSEYWDLSLVDPDNRRPVDYPLRMQTLQDTCPLPQLLAHWQDGQVKQRLIGMLLAHRSEYEALYRFGDYLPLSVKGKQAAHVLAFARSYLGQTVTVIVPLRVSSWLNAIPLTPAEKWEDTSITLKNAGRNLFTGEMVPNGALRMSEGLKHFPCAVLVSR